MGVYIKDMNMPKCCAFCAIADWEYDCCPVSARRNIIMADASGRPDFCPLVEVPQHGDLIDRDVVVMRLAEWSKQLIETYGENDEYVKCLSNVLEGLGCDDVVIPEERSKE